VGISDMELLRYLRGWCDWAATVGVEIDEPVD
jgi:hypothetical protein